MPRLSIESGSFEDWYAVVEEGGRRWMVAGGDVEGTGEDMTALAAAIRMRGSFSARRCAVRHEPKDDTFEIWSPRNSMRTTYITAAEAHVLADSIRQVLPK